MMVLALSYPQQSIAEDIFKSSEFLTWKQDNQEFYIRTSVGMASLVIMQNDRAMADCVDNWYFKDESAANSFILDSMQRFPDYHPRGIILAALEKKCGKIGG